MSVNLGNAEASITLNISNFQRAYNEVVQDLKDIKQNVTDAGKNLDFKKLGESADGLSQKLSGLSKVSAGLLTSMAATVPTTQEFRRDMSMLEQNAKNAAVGIGVTEEAFRTFNAVSGETDSSVEGISNLLQAGFTESNLQIAVEGLSGAAQKFPDTLKIESLSDSLQETLATGKSIGQFAELLDRVGVGAENFDKQLAACNTEAEKQDLVLKTLADAGLNDSYEQWAKNNKEIIDYENAMIDMQQALGKVATAMAPFVVKLSKLASEGIEAFTDLPEPIQDVSIALLAVAAAASPALKGFSTLVKSQDSVSKAASGLSKVLKAHPYTAVAAAAGILAVGIYEVVSAYNEETKAAKKASQAREEKIQSVQAENASIDSYYGKLNSLLGVENKSATQKEQIKQYVDLLNESVEGLNLSYDEETDKLNQTTDAIYEKIQAQKEQALANAYYEQSKDALEEYVKSNDKLKTVGDELADARGRWNKMTDSEKAANSSLQQNIIDLEREYGDLSQATLIALEDANRYANEAIKQSGVWDEVVAQFEKTGQKIPESVTKGINEGKYQIPTTIDELNALINFDKAVQNAGTEGQELVNQLRVQIQNGEITVQEAADILAQKFPAAVRNQKGNTQAAGREMAQAGKQGAEGVEYTSTGKSKSSQTASGIRLNAQLVSNAAYSAVQGGKTSAQSISFVGVGKDISSGIASGINKAAYLISLAAEAAIEDAKKAAKRKSESKSPSKLFKREVGKPIPQGIALGIIEDIPLIEDAMVLAIDAARKTAVGSEDIKFSTSIGGLSSEKSYNVDYGTGIEDQRPISVTNIFNSPDPLDPYACARLAIKEQRDFLQGF